MSTLKVSAIQSPSTTDGGLAISSTGAVSGGLPVPNRNLLYNGAMQVAQRGTSFTNPATGYHLDRWRVDYSSGTLPCVITQSSFAAGESAGEGWPEKYLDVAWTATASKNIYIGQRIEDVRSAGGSQVTLSFYAKANAAVDVSARVVQNFGSGGSTLVVTGFGVVGSLTTSWARYSLTFTVPSVSGKTIGSSSYLQVDLFWPTDSTGSVDLWGVQLETGPVATEFEHRSFGDELARCQRYYEKSYNNDVTPGTATIGGARYGGSPTTGVAGTTGYILGTAVFAVAKRTAPTVTLYDEVGNSNRVTAQNIGVSSTHDNQAYTANSSTGSFWAGRSGASGTRTSAHAFTYHFTADAEL